MAKSVSGSHIEVSVAPGMKEKIQAALKKGLKMVGMQVESYAKMACPADTGLLRNSITYAISGEAPATASYKADKGDGSGTYEGTAPENANGVTLYVGTNVHYAPHVELGHYQQPGRYVPAIGKRLKASYVSAKPFLRPAMEGHSEEYNQILIGELNKIDQQG